MRCICIAHPTVEAIVAASKVGDVIEIPFEERYPDSLVASWMRYAAKPLLFKGKYAQEYLHFKPVYIDIPYESFVTKAPFPIKTICSYHSNQIVEDLEFIYSKVADYYKVACFSNSISETVAFLNKKKRSHTTLIAMGEKGQLSRLLSEYIGNAFTYIPLNKEHYTAPGQLLLEELQEYPPIHPNTALFAVLGSPIVQSPGKIFHNAFFKSLQVNAAYFALEVFPEELESTLYGLKALGFTGLSITIPHKEKVATLFGYPGSVNTVLFTPEGALCTSTDAAALRKLVSLKQKKVLILGSGGSAAALAAVCYEQEAVVTIASRNKHSAQRLGEQFSATFISIEEVTEGYDVVINTTGCHIPIPLPKCTVVDLTLNGPQFVAYARSLGCHVISGKQFYIEQALLQHKFWSSYGCAVLS